MKCAALFSVIATFVLPWTLKGDEVDDYLRNQMTQHRIPGLNLEVLQHAKPVKISSYGMANLELEVPVKAST